MAGLFSFFVVVSISLLILRIATIILKFTGLSHDVASFQARSAFTGTGFTTRESELISNHPVRRRVAQTLMFVGNVGIVTLISSLVISFFDTTTSGILIHFLYLGGGLLILALISRVKWFDRFLHMVVNRALKKWTRIHIYDFESLLNLSGEFAVIQGSVTANSWIANKSLADLRLPSEGVLILGIKRKDGYFIGTPQGSTLIYEEDVLVLYGKEDFLREILERPGDKEGDRLHKEAVARQHIREGKQLIKSSDGLIGKIRNVLSRKK